jgi:hypothetical protein
MMMTSNGTTLNYKVVNLVESYNLHIKFTSIYKFLKTDRAPTAVAYGRCPPPQL